MRVTIQAEPHELATRADALIAHIEDLRDEAAVQSDSVEKAARLTIKDHPKVALTQLRRRWVTGYRDQMLEMNAEISNFLQRIASAVQSSGSSSTQM